MSYYNDGHTSLDSEVVGKCDAPALNLVLVRRTLDDRQDLVVHASSNIVNISIKITALMVLLNSGFKLNSNICSYSNGRKCVYKSFEVTEQINLEELAGVAADAAEKMNQAEQLLNDCGWSIFKERQNTISEGHRVTEKQVLKTTEDDNFSYIMTHIRDQQGRIRFVTHYIPKHGFDSSDKLLAAMEFLEMKIFNGCPETPFRQCYYTTIENEERATGVNRPADRAHRYFDNLSGNFNRACILLGEADEALSGIGLHVLNYPEPTRPVSLPGNKVPDISAIAHAVKQGQDSSYEWDVFISHASEDKDTFVRGLVSNLESAGVKVWYDEFTLKLGDRLRQSIDKGLAKSRYGVVVLSVNFFNKQWPQDELNGLAVRERNGEKVILPVWLDVDERYVASYSPTLADRVATKTSDGMQKVVSDILSVVKLGE
jgi:hypothetical protein